MGTRGALTFVVDGVEKTGYNHFDSYPSGLGKNVLEWLRHPAWDIDVARGAVRKLRMVSEDDEPTAAERAQYAVHADPGVSTGRDWYSLLRETQGNPRAILGAGVMIDSKSFPLDSLFCEWVYVVDLDNETFEIYQGFQQSKPNAGRWKDAEGTMDGYYPVNLLTSWTIKEARKAGLSSEAIMDRVENIGADVELECCPCNEEN